MSYKIASLNLLKSYRNEEQGRDFYGFIYDLIAKERLDIIAFQEMKNRIALDGIKRNLSKNWKGVHAFDSEFAYIWNSNKINECSKDSEPMIFREYKSSNRMKRDPLYGRFAPSSVNSNIELRLLNIHLEHGGINSIEAINRRKQECELAKGKIYQKIDSRRYGNFKPSFTLLLGDYNLYVDTCNLIEPFSVFTFQDEKTTLKIDNGYSESYDHFSFDIEKNYSVPFSVSRVDAVNQYFKGDFQRYRKNVSDHVPVIIEIY